ncbi:MAG: 1,4-dihydroxy-6-naphthoate synthase [Bacteroidetes bacterium]|nr:MAG: 1,4-dihydroxy-6-naphthoate synthase [Bacteroidota bacterium]
MKLTLGFSPCPNDTFIFDAMVHGRIDTEGLEFDYFLADVEELNRKALASEVDITKISYSAYAYAAQNYLILDSGSALGHRNGPLLISKRIIKPSELVDAKIAIPGKYTTANLLFSIAWPDAVNKIEYLFSDIEDALLKNEVDAGLIIHETRFTYFKRGLTKIADMGEYWEKLTRLPIPLGAIVIKRYISEDIALKVNRILRRSLEYAYKDSFASYDFVSGNAKEMDSTVMNNHIKLFVNEFSLNLGKKGKEAVNKLFRIAGERKVIPVIPDRIFLITP